MTEDLAAQVRALLDDDLSRGALKRLARDLDADPGLRDAVLAEATRRGNPLPEDASSWPGKRILRRARARDVEAMERLNPIARDEDFTCAHCGADVPAHGRTARDHCPHCLRSLHVDVVPGDRAAGCGGVLDPVRVEPAGGDGWRIHYRCRTCGTERRNRAILDGDPPDDWKQIVALTAAVG